MAPNPRVAKAFRAMREIGIPEEKTKPVLKNLLKLYEKNWELIEEENYRALADAIFDSEEAEAAEQKKKHDNAEAEALEQKKKRELAERMKVIEEETQIPEEPERPLKRLRLRHQDGHASPSCTTSSPNSNGTPLKKPKVEIDDIPYAIPRTRSHAKTNESQLVSPQSQSRNKGKQPVSDCNTQTDVTNETGGDSAIRSRHPKDKGKEPLLPQTGFQEKRSISDRPSSHGVRFKEPKVKQSPLALIKPKDEPLTDDNTSTVVVPLAVIRPESLTNNGDSSTENGPVSKAAQPLEVVNDESTTKLDIASSSSGEIKISLTCNIVGKPNISITDVDSVLKTMEDKCLNSVKLLDPSISIKKLMKDMCECLLDNETTSTPPAKPSGRCCVADPDTKDMPSDTNGSVNESQRVTEDDCENGVHNNTESVSDVIRSTHDVNDIAKGQESVIISLVNDVNNECPPSFHYIPQNAVFQNAYVNFSLARISDDNCCSTCFGDCLTSSTVCACALQSGGEFAYTKEGLVKETLLDECIKMNRDPQKHCLFYLQRGIQRKLQVFMTPGGKGWGLRTLEDLPKESELKDEEALCLDATYYGNVARFINHRCWDPTLVEIPVEVENPDHHYYHLAFFTTRKVKALEELTWDYGIDFDDETHPVKAFRCRCGSRFCRNNKRPNRHRRRRYT
ncbi:unnamed protein product [Lactuca virosa]|uniref:SET domain-containing protein n=1 Tax=Lactuca virosa TaxID=75947 RepID=A0AAU9PB23_9ASTR|nr:unnamed protein product [Lactuca virosa]